MTPTRRPSRSAKSLRTPIPGRGVTSTFTPATVDDRVRFVGLCRWTAVVGPLARPMTRAGAAVVPPAGYIVLASRGRGAVDRLRRTHDAPQRPLGRPRLRRGSAVRPVRGARPVRRAARVRDAAGVPAVRRAGGTATVERRVGGRGDPVLLAAGLLGLQPPAQHLPALGDGRRGGRAGGVGPGEVAREDRAGHRG